MTPFCSPIARKVQCPLIAILFSTIRALSGTPHQRSRFRDVAQRLWRQLCAAFPDFLADK
jgi:hypothetical protein